jgi:hemerythrin
MELIQWNDKYSVNIAEVDEQHKKLIGLINRLADAMSVGKGPKVLGKVLTELIDYTVYHFSTEENLFRQHGYPGADQHKQEHADLTAEARKLLKEFDAGNWMLTIDTLKFLSNWLNNHILSEDKKFGPFLIEKGVR